MHSSAPVKAKTRWKGSDSTPMMLCASCQKRFRLRPVRSAKRLVTSVGRWMISPDTSASP